MMDKCDKHGVELKWLAGCPAHPDNLYCPVCWEEDDMYEQYMAEQRINRIPPIDERIE